MLTVFQVPTMLMLAKDADFSVEVVRAKESPGLDGLVWQHLLGPLDRPTSPAIYSVMGVFEFGQFTASEKYIADQTVINEALDVSCKVDGFIDSFHGLQIEDSKTGYIFILWESLEHHAKLIKDPSFPAIISKLQPSIQPDSFSLQHVEFNIDPTTTIFKAPALEIAVGTLRPGRSAEDAAKGVEILSKALTEAGIANAGGKSIEKEGVWVVVVGWESAQAHIDTTKAEPFPTILGNLLQDLDIQLGHVKLIKH